jgi:agmatine/peptidylarginine deiminase
MVRFPAEWEKHKAIIMSYPHSKSDWDKYFDEIIEFYDEFIDIVSFYEEVFLICNEFHRKRFKNSKVFIAQTNDTWVRDYGVMSVETSKGIKLLDFTFNGWGLKYPANYDNLVNRKIFNTKKIDFVLEGGAIQTNGKGVILTTEKNQLEKNRNPNYTKKMIEKKFFEYFGAKKVLWLKNGTLEGDETDSHIDLLARFISEDTIAYVECEDREYKFFEEFEKMKEEILQFGFKTIPLPWAKAEYNGKKLPATYANFIFLNNALVFPTYGISNDKVAEKIFKSLFPNRDIIGIDCNVLIREGGALHCSVMELY